MKRNLFRISTVIITLAMFIAVGSAQGQSMSNRITVNIPFDFTVVDKKLPAGQYSVERAQSVAGDTVLNISGVSRPTGVLSLTAAAYSIEPKANTSLVFHRYGDQYFLFQIWNEGSTSGRAILKSRSEREIEQQSRQSFGAVVRNASALEIVSLVASSN